MRIRVEYFIDDQSADHLEVEKKIKNIMRQSADYQHGDLTVYADRNSVEECVDIQIYWRDCEHLTQTRHAIDQLNSYLNKFL